MKRKQKVQVSIFTIFIFLTILVFTSTYFMLSTFGKVSVDSIMYTILSPISGTDTSAVYKWLLMSLLPSLVLTIILTILVIKKRNKIKKLRLLWICSVCLLLIALVNFNINFDVIGYFYSKNQTTNIYEKKKVKKKDYSKIIYANSNDVKVTGTNTNNLIYIYLESYENTYNDKANGGIKDTSCMKELASLANENTNFSNTDKLGGAISFTGTTWTIASMVSQLSGIPLKVEVANNMGKYNEFMPGARMLGDILRENGYNQELLVGSDSSFAGTDKLFSQHGNYTIVDYDDIKKTYGYTNSDLCSWGVNDHKLFEVARSELTNLASKGKFNFTMATIDCHMPRGIHCNYCPKTYSNTYENIYACQSKQVSEFISWCQTQTWYKDTTIILVGDHQSMAQNYFKDVDSNYVRTTYNCIINSKTNTKKTSNRNFTSLDMYPTTLAALGFKIKGNKLGLGTNLYSNLPTVIEKYSTSYIEEEVSKSSEYLNKNIYKFE